MTSMQLVTNKIIEYAPEFDPDTNLYYDKWPYKKYERNCPTFKCPCKAGETTFSTNSGWKQHINSKCHKAWLAECSNNRKNSKIVEKDLTIKIRQYQQQVTRLINEVEQLKKKANEAQRVAGEKTINLETTELELTQACEAQRITEEENSELKEQLAEMERENFKLQAYKDENESWLDSHPNKKRKMCSSD